MCQQRKEDMRKSQEFIVEQIIQMMNTYFKFDDRILEEEKLENEVSA